jgi:hypothetical protein
LARDGGALIGGRALTHYALPLAKTFKQILKSGG